MHSEQVSNVLSRVHAYCEVVRRARMSSGLCQDCSTIAALVKFMDEKSAWSDASREESYSIYV